MTEQALLRIGRYGISKDLFRFGYPGGQSPCTCTSTCCSWGVYVDVAERDRILEHSDAIVSAMDDSQPHDPALWFETDVDEDPDFVSGRCVGTHVHNNKCAFLDRQGRCAIQLAAVAQGLHRWAWKPMYCVLYPIEVSDGVVGFDPMLQDEQPCCSIAPRYAVPLFRACRDELTHLLGEQGYEMLEEHYRGLEKEISSRNIEASRG